MNKMNENKNVLKLNDSDKKTLLNYSDALIEHAQKPVKESTVETCEYQFT